MMGVRGDTSAPLPGGGPEMIGAVGKTCAREEGGWLEVMIGAVGKYSEAQSLYIASFLRAQLRCCHYIHFYSFK